MTGILALCTWHVELLTASAGFCYQQMAASADGSIGVRVDTAFVSTSTFGRAVGIVACLHLKAILSLML
jgi:hypothetical protein